MFFYKDVGATHDADPSRPVRCAGDVDDSPLLAAKQPTEKEMLRQEAEHVCYGDAQRLCADAMPDAEKVEACMKAKRAQVSPECKSVFDKASKL